MHIAQALDQIQDLYVESEYRDVFIDFDYTLFRSNSTEQYLASARPAWIVTLLLLLMRRVLPWRRLIGRKWFRISDYILVVTVTFLLPWNIWRWRRKSPQLFANLSSSDLLDRLKEVPLERIFIVSFGFDMLIGPLLHGTRLEGCRRIALPLLASPARLRQGKRILIERCLGRDRLARGIMVTDSLDDHDVLDEVQIPILIEPTGPCFIAEQQMYLPLRYTAYAKYSLRFVKQQIFSIELIIILLAILPEIVINKITAVSATLLFISLYAVYEIGYFENDHLSAKHEIIPSVTAAAESYHGFPLEWHAWPWSIVIGFIGCLLINFTKGGFLNLQFLLNTSISWAAVLIATRAIFYIYNRRQANRRILFYPMLQLAKLFGVFVILPPVIFGVALAFAQLIMMWMNYGIYRSGGDKSNFPRDGVRLLGFVTLSAGLILAQRTKLTLVDALAGGAMLLWVGGRALAAKIDSGRFNSRATPLK